MSSSLQNCISFEESSVQMVASDGLQANRNFDPLNSLNRVAQLIKTPASQSNAGVRISTTANAMNVDLISLSSSKIITLRVYSPAAGHIFMLKLETGPGFNGLQAQATTTRALAWETVTFDFSQPSAGTYNAQFNYNTVSIFPAFGNTFASNQVFYIDELSMRNPQGKRAGWTLVWADEFSGNGLPDTDKWDYETSRNAAGWYNNELQYYSRADLDNSRIADGSLRIKAIKEIPLGISDYGGQRYTSARLVTRGKASWLYGYVEVRAQLPCSLGTWPAIWMLGTQGTWPDDGEIDIMEQRGLSSLDKSRVLGTIHTSAYNYFSGSLGVAKGGNYPVTTACTGFHTYHLTWTTDAITVGVDGTDYFTYPNPRTGSNAQWPFDQPQYLLLNLAMGGDLGGAVPSGFVSDQMQVDYVRVHQK
jgi:beta-glucanase (GH16 family)